MAKEIGGHIAPYWNSVKSSWVKRIKYVWEDKELFVQFKGSNRHPSGVVCRYDDIGENTAWMMLFASSKGKFVWEFLINRPYSIVG